MMSHFMRDKAAAKKQESDWRTLVAEAKRAYEFIPKPCAYCGILMTMCTKESQGTRTNETKDHVIPRCKGGTVTVACCERCNSDKHHLTLNEWRCVLMLRRRRPVFFFFERSAAENAAIDITYLLSRLLSC